MSCKLPCTASLGALFMRYMLGFIFVYHGFGKVMDIQPMIDGLTAMQIPMPTVSAWLAAGAEFGGGILLAIGLLTRLATIPMMFTMFVAITKVHWGHYDIQAGGMEFALTMFVMLLSLALIGPGRFSADALIFRGCCCGKSTNI
ncbi:MAG: DoxX family membrane protein [Planctomycetes bacterium]|nr:DoxX family membrane protein [Planctomycetota bacterium]